MKRILLGIIALVALVACGDLGPNPASSRFNARFHYYYSEECDYGLEGAYNCSEISAVSPSYTVGLKIDYDGYAMLNMDGTMFDYVESEYSEGYDGYRYFYQFYEGHQEITIYADGDEMVYLDELSNIVIFYYADLYY
ncbi:hypothetical protein [Fibrobacter sp. UBA4309]|jgi:hypothetical protein|uniref:hypothetical protein n=1 Tax=Fibrobacter sp. UBA4309 TaxID=1946537 RepID=UPI0025BB755F|nr:hypothetical protein [Fibrobacter sp. UBA4309]